MEIRAHRASVADVRPFRERHRAEMSCQIVHDSLHERGFTHPWLLSLGGRSVGYGTVVGFGDDPKETVDEFFIEASARGAAERLFAAFVDASSATAVQAQTNDPLLLLMLLDFTEEIHRDRILFDDGFTTVLTPNGTRFRGVEEDDGERLFDGRPVSEAGDWLLERDGEVVAVGGVMDHYNPPWGDLYMAVTEAHRRRGYGAYLVQELKRVCYDIGLRPAARCRADHVASRATLQRAGMLPCGSILIGRIHDRRPAPRDRTP